MRTPGVPNPLSYSSEDELKAELKAQGEARGWSPMPGYEDDIEHYGTKGMRWGVRKSTSNSNTPKPKSSKGKKVAKITAGMAVAAGAAFVGYKMSQSGNVKMSDISSSAKTVNAGKKAAESVLASNFKKQAADLSKDIAEANASQDAWMRSLGLGAVVNNRVGL
jgi:hypothetical protein